MGNIEDLTVASKIGTGGKNLTWTNKDGSRLVLSVFHSSDIDPTNAPYILLIEVTAPKPGKGNLKP
jgi:hypothetical protein